MPTPKTIGIEYRFKTGRIGVVLSDLNAAKAAVGEAIRDGAEAILVTPGRIPAPTLADDLRRYCVAKYGSAGDLRCYYQDEWLARREEHGNGAPLTATIEGTALLQDLNGYSEDREARQRYEAFGRFCEERGWFWELGFTWSLHFYPTGGKP